MNNKEQAVKSNSLLRLEREVLTATSAQKDFVVKSFNDISICRSIVSGILTEELASQIIEIYQPYKDLMKQAENKGSKVIFIPVTFTDSKRLEIDDIYIQLKYTICSLRLPSDKYKNLYINDDLIKIMEENKVKLYTDNIGEIHTLKDVEYILDAILDSTLVLNTEELLKIVNTCVNIDTLHNIYVKSNDKFNNNSLLRGDINKANVWITWSNIVDKLNNIIAAITIKYGMLEDSKLALSKLTQDANEIKSYINSKEFVINREVDGVMKYKANEFIDFYKEVIDYLNYYENENN